eukprot:Gb_32714 [translate_table: standard]
MATIPPFILPQSPSIALQMQYWLTERQHLTSYMNPPLPFYCINFGSFPINIPPAVLVYSPSSFKNVSSSHSSTDMVGELMLNHHWSLSYSSIGCGSGMFCGNEDPQVYVDEVWWSVNVRDKSTKGHSYRRIEVLINKGYLMAQWKVTDSPSGFFREIRGCQYHILPISLYDLVTNGLEPRELGGVSDHGQKVCGCLEGGAIVISNLPREGGDFPLLSVIGIGVPKEGSGSEDARSGAVGKDGTSTLFSRTSDGGEGFKELENSEGILVMAFLPFASEEEIGNALGSFVEADMSLQDTGSMMGARILVRLVLREGFAENKVLQKGTHSFVQTLDYTSVPFRCNRFHIYGHLVVECPLSFKRRVWVKKSRLSPIVENAARSEEGYPRFVEEVRLEAKRDMEGFKGTPSLGKAMEDFSLNKALGGDIVSPVGLQNFPARMLAEEGGMGNSRLVVRAKDLGYGSWSRMGEGLSCGWGRGSFLERFTGEKDSSSPDISTSSNTKKKETLCVGGKVVDDLTKMFGGWIFMFVDTRGRINFWELLLNKDFMRRENLILGDGLNFSLEDSARLKQWTSSRGDYDHFPTVLELVEVGKRPSSPFNFNPGWLEEDEFIQLARDLWATIRWAHTKKIKEAKELLEVESKLEVLYDAEGVVYVSEETKAEDKPPRQIVTEYGNRDGAWAFFDGVVYGEP